MIYINLKSIYLLRHLLLPFYQLCTHNLGGKCYTTKAVEITIREMVNSFRRHESWNVLFMKAIRVMKPNCENRTVSVESNTSTVENETQSLRPIFLIYIVRPLGPRQTPIYFSPCLFFKHWDKKKRCIERMIRHFQLKHRKVKISCF